VTFEPLHYLLNFRVFTLIFAVFLSHTKVELLSVRLQGFNVEYTSDRISHTTLRDFSLFRPKIWLPRQRALELCNQKCVLQIGRPQRLPFISNHIPVVSRSNAFIAILVPKLVAMVTPLCPLCTGVSQMNFPIPQTLSQNQILHGYDAYNWNCGHCCDIIDYFDQKLFAMAISLRPLQSEMSLQWLITKTVTSNHILAISCRNAFIAISVIKIGCHGKTPLSLVYWRVTDEFIDREFGFYEFFSFLKFNEFYEFFSVEKN